MHDPWVSERTPQSKWDWGRVKELPRIVDDESGFDKNTADVGQENLTHNSDTGVKE